MPLFSYTATNPEGKITTGTADLSDKNAVIDMLTRQKLRPISIKERTESTSGFSLARLFKSKRIKPDALAIFTRELSAMVGAGVPLLRALNSLEKHTESPALKRILIGITKDVEGGSALADALAKYPNDFNDVYVNMVRAGEAAGILDGILQRLALQQEKNNSIRKKIKSAMTYPTVLISITVVAFLGLMLFVIPQISNILRELGGPDAQLPVLTRIMLSISDFFVGRWFIVLPVLAGIIILITRYIKTPKGKRRFHKFILKLPVIKTIITKITVAQFARTFSVLMGAGVAVLESLRITAHSVGNVIYEEALIETIEEVKNGKQLSRVIAINDLFPPIVSQMLAVGEETGQTDKVLIKVADFYEDEVEVAISGLSSLIEPLMIIIIGGLVGIIAASVMMPIAGLAQNIR
jgi:type IV pilus assembly protein PilC